MLHRVRLGYCHGRALLDPLVRNNQMHVTTEEKVPALKPGKFSSEYTGKITVQVVLGLVALSNLVIERLGHPSILMDAETAAFIAVALEALWTMLRQGNKALEIRAQRDVAVAQLQKDKETNQ